MRIDLRRLPRRPLWYAGVVLFLLAPFLLFADPGSASGVAETSVTAALVTGFLFGLKHAFDADHLVAVGAIVSERRSTFGAALVGAMWGLGHTLSLLLVGIVVVLLRMPVPEELALGLEFLVAVMISGLGLHLLYRIIRSRGASLHLHEHSHGGLRHTHPHLHFTDGEGESGGHHHHVRGGRKPFLVGMMHGLAGSAALMLLVLSTITSPLHGLLYIAIFGGGSILGMFLVGAVMSLPYSWLSRRFTGVDTAFRVAAALMSIAFGAYLIYEIGFVEGLLI